MNCWSLNAKIKYNAFYLHQMRENYSLLGRREMMIRQHSRRPPCRLEIHFLNSHHALRARVYSREGEQLDALSVSQAADLEFGANSQKSSRCAVRVYIYIHLHRFAIRSFKYLDRFISMRTSGVTIIYMVPWKCVVIQSK